MRQKNNIQKKIQLDLCINLQGAVLIYINSMRKNSNPNKAKQ